VESECTWSPRARQTGWFRKSTSGSDIRGEVEVEVYAEENERPEEQGEDEGNQRGEVGDGVAVRECDD
jgi:hypothetical protein